MASREEIENAARELLESLWYFSIVNGEIRRLQEHHVQQFTSQVTKGIIQQVNAALMNAAKAMCDECRMDHHVDEQSCLALPIRALKIP